MNISKRAEGQKQGADIQALKWTIWQRTDKYTGKMSREGEKKDWVASTRGIKTDFRRGDRGPQGKKQRKTSGGSRNGLGGGGGLLARGRGGVILR